MLSFVDAFGIGTLRWRVTRKSILYRHVGHGPSKDGTGKVSEVTTFISSNFRMILGDVTSNYYVLSNIWNWYSAEEGDTHKSFIPRCRTWRRDKSNGNSS